MPEWILKFTTAISSAKTAINLLLTVVLIVLGWARGSSFFDGSGIPTDLVPFLLLLTSFSIALIVTEIAYKVSKGVKKLCKYLLDIFNNKREKLQQQEETRVAEWEKANLFREKLNLTFPYLDNRSQKTLFWLYEKEHEALDGQTYPYYDLHKKGLISYNGDASGGKKIYALNPIVRDYLSELLSKQNNEHQAELLKELDDYSRQFLRIFFDEDVPFGVPEQEKWMDSLVYRSHKHLVRIKAIDKKNEDTFILSSDFKDKLIRDGHFKTCHRTEVTLDPSHIQAYIPTQKVSKKPF